MIKLIEKIDNKIVKTPLESICFSKEYDIAVVGLGTAGAVSAITASRYSKTVLGIERFNAPGGTMTMGGVGGYYFGGKGGLYEEIDSVTSVSPVGTCDTNYIHPDQRKYYIDRFLDNPLISLMYESVVTGIYCEDDIITGIRVFSSGSERNFGIKALIDATGDGDICDLAGCSMSFGRDEDNSVVPYSVVRSYMKNDLLCKTNHDCGKVDQRDVWAFSDSLIRAYSTFCNEDDRGLTVRLHSLPGIREGRLLNGYEKITLSDILSANMTDKPVMYAYSDLDKHGIDIAFDTELFVKWHILANLGALNITVSIPLGALVAKEYTNLITAGRCISVDHDTATLVRMNRDVQKMGEVAATAASLSIDGNVRIIDVNYDLLKSYLQKSGCLNEQNNRGYYYDGGKDESYIRPAKWLDDKDDILAGLSTLSPGLFIWSAKLMGDGIADSLMEALSSENDNLRKHSAIALAVMGRLEGEDVLKGMVTERDRTMLSDMRKQNKRRISQAIMALGILKCEDSIDMILDIVCDREEYKHYPYENGYNPCYYRTLSSAVSSLLMLIKAYPHHRNRVMNVLERELSDYSYIKEITTLESHTSEYVQAYEIYERVRNFADK